MYLLSICIPTYNRCDDLSSLLESIIKNCNEQISRNEIEIVISDNASEDGTKYLVDTYRNRINTLKYHRNNNNIGFANNIRNVINIADGKYCWLMGDDDQIMKSAIDSVLKALLSDPDIVIGNRNVNGVERKYLVNRGFQTFMIEGHSDFATYVLKCQEISAVFAFISTLIVSKKYWNSVDCTEWEKNHPYTHTLQICRCISEKRTNLQYIDTPLVEAGYNITELNYTILPYFKLDLLTIVYIYEKIFKSYPPLVHAYRKLFKMQYTPLQVLKSRVESTVDEWNALIPNMMHFEYSNYLLLKKSYDPLLRQVYYLAKKMNVVHKINRRI